MGQVDKGRLGGGRKQLPRVTLSKTQILVGILSGSYNKFLQNRNQKRKPERPYRRKKEGAKEARVPEGKRKSQGKSRRFKDEMKRRR